MRAFYIDAQGRSANLCLYLNQETTRLTVRDADGSETLRREYPSWEAAKSALAELGTGWINELTGGRLD